LILADIKRSMEVSVKYLMVKKLCLWKGFAAIGVLLFHFTASAQYYPAPKPISAEKENHLLILLKNSKPDKNRANLLLDLANINVNKPLRKKTDLDRAKSFAIAASELSFKMHDLSGYNKGELFTADVFTLENNMEAAEGILSLLNDTSKINLLLNLSFKYWLRDLPKKEVDWQKALLFANQARQLCIRYHLPAKEILALKDIAMVHTDQGKPSAEGELQEVLKRYKAIGYPYLHYTYSQLAELYYERGNPDKALFYSMQTIKSMQMTGDSVAAGDFYALHSTICINNEDYQSGIYFINSAINSYKIHAGKMSLADRRLFGVVPRALRKMKKYKEALAYVRKAIKDYPPLTTTDQITYASIMGNIYRDMKNYDRAASYFLKALQLSNNQNRIDFIDTYRNIGQLYVESGEYAKAKPYLNKVWETFGNQMASDDKSHMNYMLYLVDSATHDYRGAMKHLSDYRGLEEFNLRKAQDEEVKRLEAQYSLKEKDNNLKIKDQKISFLKQNYTLAEIKLRQSKLEKNITIGGIFVLLIIIGLLYKQYRNNKRTNLVMTKKSEEIASKNEIISHKNKHLELLLQEREWLIKEVHHRVKNNLQTIISLLESQAAYLENDALKAIQKSQHRIYTMSLIHQKLYQSEDIQTIDMAIYIPELVNYLKDSSDKSHQIDFKLKIDKINLDTSIAIPIALIINEALTNSIKYAFPNNINGEVSISLRQRGESVRLEVADNGIGIKANSIKADSVSLGLQLIKGLTKEIHGNVNFSSNHGAKIVVIFKKHPLQYAHILEPDLMTMV